jgi:hypothetical protein
MKRTTIWLNPAHMKELGTLGKSTGQRPAQLVRVAILEYIRRAKRAQAAQVVIPGPARRQAFGE